MNWNSICVPNKMTGRHNNSTMIMLQAGQPWNQSYFQHVKEIFFFHKHQD